jgi:serine/threonine protein kinase
MTTKAKRPDEIYFAALEQGSPEARAAYLDLVCGSDIELRRHVERLLDAQPNVGSFLDAPAVGPTLTLGQPHGLEGPGTVISPYKLLESIGEGGMGVVYMAEQTQPVRRKVALKIIKPGMDTKQVVARFESERQALALMDHPNIARVLDAGATSSGRPFFVMELVRGIPITDYCDREHLSMSDRLDLFVLVCRAVQHAHQKGIIHRDLKPSNVLVTVIDGAAVPKVIDFGIAKATGGSLTERTLFTGFAQLIGTPLYMSPEQVELSGVDVDTRSDIYSLGVLLYELLTGTTPFDQDTLRKAAMDEMRRIIREEEPPKPSTRLSTLGQTLTTVPANRKADLRRLGRSMRGELDWVVMKALEKDRRRRYETANDFAADVMRYQTDQPVEACPPSAWYRLSKFVRRHRIGLTTSGLLVTTLVVGSTVSAWQALRAREAEAEAERLADDTQLVVNSLVNDVIRAAAPAEARGEPIRVIELLRSADKTLPTKFRGRPKAEAAFHRALAEAYSSLAHHEEAEDQIRRAVEIRTQVSGPEHPETLATMAYRVILLSRLGISNRATQEEAIQLGLRLLEAERRVLGPKHPESLTTLYYLGFVYLQHGDFREASDMLGSCLTDRVRLLGIDHVDSIAALHQLGVARHALGDLETAERMLTQALAGQRRSFGPRHPTSLYTLSDLALVVRDRGRNDEAVPMLREVVVGLREHHASPFFSSARHVCANYVDALREQGDAAAIRDLCQGWVRDLLEMPREADPTVRRLKMVHQSCHAFWLSTLPEGVPFDNELAVRAAEQAAEQGDSTRDRNWTRLASVYLRLGDTERAQWAVRESIDRRKGGDRFDWVVQALINAHRGELDQARAWFKRATAEHNGRDVPGVGYGESCDAAAALLGVPPQGQKRRNFGPAVARDEARPMPDVPVSPTKAAITPPSEPKNAFNPQAARGSLKSDAERASRR